MILGLGMVVFWKCCTNCCCAYFRKQHCMSLHSHECLDLFFSLLVSSEGAHRQRPNNARCSFRNFFFEF